MSNDTSTTQAEIEQTREDLARKVDDLVGRAKVEAAEAGKKVGIAIAALAGLLVVGLIAKRRVGR
jgi:tetrahydromethanopterin S-methyltransferase subunit G